MTLISAETVSRQSGPTDLDDEPAIGRSAALGALLGFVVVTIAIAAAGILTGIEAGSAIGLGAFIGIWGGSGFGLMVGATIAVARQTGH